ncbi:prepilin peptidase [Candidatus Micrarchaeota archaeon]|nr:prepilin peptidase [Candidatus Micrarchaeota archaeon]
MNLELLRVVLAVGFTAVAAWQDWKTSFIDDRMTAAMIGAGIVLNLLTLDLNFIVYSLGIAGIIFGIGYFLYRTGQLGGGDVLLFTGIQLLLPYYPLQIAAYLPTFFAQVVSAYAALSFYPFFLSILLASSFLGLAGTAIWYTIKLQGRKLKPDFLAAGLMVFLAAVVLFLLNSFGGSSVFQISFIVVVFGSAVFLFTFKKQITEEIIIKRVSLPEIEEEDVIALEKLPPKLVEEYGLERVLTKKEVEKLKKIEKAKKVHLFPVYKVLPRFGPYILAGLVFSLLFGDLFFLLLYS